MSRLLLLETKLWSWTLLLEMLRLLIELLLSPWWRLLLLLLGNLLLELCDSWCLLPGCLLYGSLLSNCLLYGSLVYGQVSRLLLNLFLYNLRLFLGEFLVLTNCEGDICLLQPVWMIIW